MRAEIDAVLFDFGGVFTASPFDAADQLERTPDGAHYRVGFPLGDPVFELEVDEGDVRATVAAYIDYQRRRKRRNIPFPSSFPQAFWAPAPQAPPPAL